MFYESLFNPSIHRPVKACLTGAGEFGASFLFQAQGMPLLEVPAVCTRTVQRAVDAYENAGIPASKVRVCESAEDAKKAYADGFNVVVDSFEYIADLPLTCWWKAPERRKPAQPPPSLPSSAVCTSSWSPRKPTPSSAPSWRARRPNAASSTPPATATSPACSSGSSAGAASSA